MMTSIALFEFKTRVSRLSTWIYFLVFFVLAMLWIAAAGGLFKDANISFGSGKVFVNSPFALAQTVSLLGMFGVIVMAAVMGRAVQQDAEYRSHHFSLPRRFRNSNILAAGSLARSAYCW